MCECCVRHRSHGLRSSGNNRSALRATEFDCDPDAFQSWRVAQAFDLAGAKNKVGAPSLAHLAKGGNLGTHARLGCRATKVVSAGSLPALAKNARTGHPQHRWCTQTSSKGWATRLNLFAADCSGASFRGAVLEGANLKSACLRYADFTGTIIKADQLGKASSFAHADLSKAVLVEAVVEGTEYDAETIFPIGFDPERHGMISVPIVDAWLVKPVCKSS